MVTGVGKGGGGGAVGTLRFRLLGLKACIDFISSGPGIYGIQMYTLITNTIEISLPFLGRDY